MAKPSIFVFVTASGRAKDAPELIHRIVAAGWKTYTVITPNVNTVLPPVEIYNVAGSHAVQSYKDQSLRTFPFGTMLVAPCTFNTFNKLALGIADNLATSMISDALGGKCPVYIAPAMRYSLWNHPQTRESEDRLKKWGCNIIPPKLEDQTSDMASLADIIHALQR